MDPWFNFNPFICQITSHKSFGLFSPRNEWAGLSFSADRLAETFIFACKKSVMEEDCESLSTKWEFPDMFKPVKYLIPNWDPEDSHMMYLFALRVNVELLDSRIPRDSIKVRIYKKTDREFKAGIASETIDCRWAKGFFHKIDVRIYEIDEPDQEKRLFSYFGSLLHELVNVLFWYYCCRCNNCEYFSSQFDRRGVLGYGIPWQIIARIVENLAKVTLDIDVDLKRPVAMAQELLAQEMLGLDLTDDSKWNFGERTREKFDLQWFGMDFNSITRIIRDIDDEIKE